jgi:glycine cleavage system H protein
MTLYFTRDHEWVQVEGDIATIGITDYAQGQLGDVVFVELPSIGTEVAAGKEAAVVESVKAASDVYAPLSGEVVKVNEALVDEPGLVNTAAEAAGWFFQLRLSDPREVEGLLDAAAYQALVATL